MPHPPPPPLYASTPVGKAETLFGLTHRPSLARHQDGASSSKAPGGRAQAQDNYYDSEDDEWCGIAGLRAEGGADEDGPDARTRGPPGEEEDDEDDDDYDPRWQPDTRAVRKPFVSPPPGPHLICLPRVLVRM